MLVGMDAYLSPAALLADQYRRMRASIVSGGSADAITPAINRLNLALLDASVPVQPPALDAATLVALAAAAQAAEHDALVGEAEAEQALIDQEESGGPLYVP
jgi:hypothetical protein